VGPGAGLGRSGEEENLLSIGIRTADLPVFSVVPLPTVLPRLRVYCIMYIAHILVFYFLFVAPVEYIFRIIRVFSIILAPPPHHYPG